jgi:hypothetical protein
LRVAGAFDALTNPFKRAAVFAIAGPEPFANVILAKPIHEINLRQLVAVGALREGKPVREIIAHVIAAEWQHCEGVPAQHTGLAERGVGGFRAAGRTHENAVFPIESFIHERNRFWTASAKQDCRKRHAFGVLPVGINDRTLRRRRGETGIGMRTFFVTGRRPFVAMPVNPFFWRGHAHIFPPHVVVRSQHNVGKDAVFGKGGEGIRVRLHRSARGNAEKSGLRIHGIETSIFSNPNPGNVIANTSHFPTRQRRLHNGEIGFAAGAGEGGGDVIFFPLWRGQAKDEHVFGHPAFAFGNHRRDAEREAFFAKQRVPAIAGTVRPDRRFVREMNDVSVFWVRLAGPGNIFLAGLQRRADRVHTGDESSLSAEFVERNLAHARHDTHVDDDIR